MAPANRWAPTRSDTLAKEASPINEDLLTQQFNANRPHLRAVAYRMLGSLAEAEDAVQDTWLRLSGSDTTEVANLTGWLTTVVSRVCLDMLRSRKARHEESLEAQETETAPARGQGSNPAEEVLLAESVGLAMLVVLQKLSPAERVAFVLHDMFDFPFHEIEPIIGRSATATRQLASRARRRVQGQSHVSYDELTSQRTLVEAFLAASRSGHFKQLLMLLDPDVVVRADHIAQKIGGTTELRGGEAVARFFLGRATGARVALVDGEVAAIVAPRGKLLFVLRFSIANGKVVELDAIAAPENLQQLDLAVLDDRENVA